MIQIILIFLKLKCQNFSNKPIQLALKKPFYASKHGLPRVKTGEMMKLNLQLKADTSMVNPILKNLQPKYVISCMNRKPTPYK